MSKSLPLVKEVIGFLNNIKDNKFSHIALHSILSWLKAKHRSPLLLPCLQSACHCLNQMTTAVAIIECCITARFNTDLHDPSDAQSIWQLILSSFQVPVSMTDEFINACVNKNAFLSLYCYILEKIPKSSSSECKRLLLLSIIDWIKRCDLSVGDEAKCILLWDKVLELSIMLALEENLQVVKGALSQFCAYLLSHGEDKSSDGLLGAVGFGRASTFSVNFRFLCRIVVAFILLQIPDNTSIRLEPMDPGFLPVSEIKDNSRAVCKSTDPAPSSGALKAIENVKLLLKNKPYSALRDLVSSAIDFMLDPRNSLRESRPFLKTYAVHVFPKQMYLNALD